MSRPDYIGNAWCLRSWSAALHRCLQAAWWRQAPMCGCVAGCHHRAVWQRTGWAHGRWWRAVWGSSVTAAQAAAGCAVAGWQSHTTGWRARTQVAARCALVVLALVLWVGGSWRGHQWLWWRRQCAGSAAIAGWCGCWCAGSQRRR